MELDINEAKKVLKECAGITKFKLAGGIDKVHDLQAHAKERLAKLRAELPEALASQVLGGEESEAKRIKTEIAEHEETLKDAPLTLEGLTRLQASNDEKMREANRVIEKHEFRLQYDALKDEIRASSYPDRAIVDDDEAEINSKLNELRRIANSIDHYGDIQKDFSQFIREMQDQHKRFRITG